MRAIFFILALSLLCLPVGAVINITPVAVGSSYIVWEWNPGLDLTDMYIDNNLMCGYETTDNTYAITGLKPVEEHNITIYTITDTGSNTTFTLGTNTTYVGGGDDGSSSIALGATGAIIGGIIIWKRRRDDEP